MFRKLQVLLPLKPYQVLQKLKAAGGLFRDKADFWSEEHRAIENIQSIITSAQTEGVLVHSQVLDVENLLQGKPHSFSWIEQVRKR